MVLFHPPESLHESTPADYACFVGAVQSRHGNHFIIPMARRCFGSLPMIKLIAVIVKQETRLA